MKQLNESQIKFYGATWCPDCRRASAFLDQSKVNYEYINIDEVEGAAEEVEEMNNGMRSVPTIIFPDLSILVEPSNEELKEKLKANELL